MRKIIKISKALRKFLGFFVFIPVPMALLVSAASVYAEFPGMEKLSVLFEGLISLFGLSKGEVSSWEWWHSLIFLSLLIVFTYWLWQLKHLFAFYAQGKIFTVNSSMYFRRVARVFLGISILSTLACCLFSIFLNVDRLINSPLFCVALIVLQLSNILAGIAWVVMGWVMEEGRHLQEEIDSTI